MKTVQTYELESWQSYQHRENKCPVCNEHECDHREVPICGVCGEELTDNEIEYCDGCWTEVNQQ